MGSNAAWPAATFEKSTPALAHTKPWGVSEMMRPSRSRRTRVLSESTRRLRASKVRGVDGDETPFGLGDDLLRDDDDVVVNGAGPPSGSGRPARHPGRLPGCPRPGPERSSAPARGLVTAHLVSWWPGLTLSLAGSTCAEDGPGQSRCFPGPGHDRLCHYAAHPLGLDAVGQIGVCLVHDQRPRQRRP